MKSEIQRIKQVYEDRDLVYKKLNSIDYIFNAYIQFERELVYTFILRKQFIEVNDLKILEIGAGNGSNLFFFKRFGLKWENIYANELMEERFNQLSKNFEKCHLYSGDASVLDFKEYFDIVFQSTVFTSILDDDFKKKLADKMFTMIKPEGVVLWYDFIYNNPKNPNVKGVKRNEIIQLFPLAKKITFYKVTLAPPIGRKIGNLYPIINFLFPFLRTHLVAVIHK
jgi:SAM-dependent methyltransferase